MQAAMADLRDGALMAEFKAIARKFRKRLGAQRRASPGTRRSRRHYTLRRHVLDPRGPARTRRRCRSLHLARIESIADVEEAHEARIRVKRLRYLVEPLQGVLPQSKDFGVLCKSLQDILGDLNDARVLDAELSKTRAPEGTEGERVGPGLGAIRREVHARRERLYARLTMDWIRGLAAPMRALVNQMIFTCTAAGTVTTEIERKFLLSGLPTSMPGAETGTIHQGWLPGAHPRERLRCRTSRGDERIWRRTMKTGRGLERVEVEDDLAPEIFDVLWPLTAGCRVHKRRHVVPVGERVWEIDEFLDRDGLYFAEIELDSTDEEVRVPDWLAPVIVRDVTEEDGFTNLELAR